MGVMRIVLWRRQERPELARLITSSLRTFIWTTSVERRNWQIAFRSEHSLTMARTERAQTRLRCRYGRRTKKCWLQENTNASLPNRETFFHSKAYTGQLSVMRLYFSE